MAWSWILTSEKKKNYISFRVECWCDFRFDRVQINGMNFPFRVRNKIPSITWFTQGWSTQSCEKLEEEKRRGWTKLKAYRQPKIWQKKLLNIPLDKFALCGYDNEQQSQNDNGSYTFFLIRVNFLSILSWIFLLTRRNKVSDWRKRRLLYLKRQSSFTTAIQFNWILFVIYFANIDKFLYRAAKEIDEMIKCSYVKTNAEKSFFICSLCVFHCLLDFLLISINIWICKSIWKKLIWLTKMVYVHSQTHAISYQIISKKLNNYTFKSRLLYPSRYSHVYFEFLQIRRVLFLNFACILKLTIGNNIQENYPCEKGEAAFVVKKKIPLAPTLPIGPPIRAVRPVWVHCRFWICANDWHSLPVKTVFIDCR